MRRLIPYLVGLTAVLALVAAFAFASYGRSVDAQDQAGPRDLVFLDTSAVSATGNSGAVCGLAAYDLFASQVILTGTPAGTNPTFDFVWQNSIDGGVTWTTVRTFTQINATVTPAAQLHTAAEVQAQTPVVFGDCWRVAWTVGGTGSPLITARVAGYAE